MRKKKHQGNCLLEKVLLQYLMKCHKTCFITQFSTEVYMLESIPEFRSTANMSIHRRSFETFEKVPYKNKSELKTFFLGKLESKATPGASFMLPCLSCITIHMDYAHHWHCKVHLFQFCEVLLAFWSSLVTTSTPCNQDPKLFICSLCHSCS